MNRYLPINAASILRKFAFSKLILGFSLTGVLYILYKRHRRTYDVIASTLVESDKLKYPPGPNPSDKNLGNIGDIAAAGSLHQYLTTLHKEFNSEIVGFWFGANRMYSIASVSTFKHHKNLFDKSSIVFRQFESLLTARSLLFANGKDAQNRRKLYDKSFSHEELLKMIPVLNEAGDKFLVRLSGDNTESKDMTPEIMYSTIYAVTVCTFGDFFKDEKKTREIFKCYDLVMRVMESRLVEGDPPAGSEKEKEFILRKQNIRNIIDEAIQYRKSERAKKMISNSHLLIDALIDTYGNDDEMIFAESMTYLLGGFHTTAYTLTWTFYYCSLYPEIQEKMSDEVLRVVGKDNLGSVTTEHISNLNYCRAVINEVSRITCIVPLTGRYASEDMTINGYHVPAETPVIHALGVLFWDPDVFPEPHKFIPERFLGDNEEKNSGLQFKPFGFAGKRMCPGYKFATNESIMWIAKWMGRGLRVSFDEKRTGVVEREYRLATIPKNPIYFYFSL